jgi:hypothetical protein
MSVTTWNTAPDYDQWGSDTSWNCNDWILWHKFLLEKFGKAKANFMWDYAFAQSGNLSSNLNCRTLNSSFRDYVRKNDLNPYANAGIFAPVLQGVGTIQDVTGGVLTGVSSVFTSNNVKGIFNIVAIGAVIFGGLYAYRTLKK